MRLFVAAWCLLCSLALADTRSVTVTPGIAELPVTAAAGSDVTWESRQPIDLSYRSYSLADGRSVIVFCAAKGQRYVIVSDVIDWDARSREKTTWIVTVGEGGDDTDPPGPDPGPEPNPPGPVPDNVPNKYGIGPAIAPLLASKDKAQIEIVARGLLEAEQRLNSSSITPQQMLSSIYATLAEKGWRDVSDALQSSITKAGEQYGFGITPTKNYLREARLTVELFK